MYYSFFGKITHILKHQIVINVHDISYVILVANPNGYTIGEATTIYTHFIIREDEQYLVGFKSIEEKEAFLTLISVKGVGPKTALNALSGTAPENLYQAISAGDISFLKKLPGIGARAANQIILDLKGKLDSHKSNPNYEQVKKALLSLGFKAKEINKALGEISLPRGSKEEILKEALKRLHK